jgi:hypothetical protein
VHMSILKGWNIFAKSYWLQKTIEEEIDHGNV